MGSRSRTQRLVGRGAELARLLDAFDAGEETGQVVLVSGEAGVGKSRLLAAFEQRHDDALFVHGACVDAMGAELPYAPWTELLWWLVKEAGDALPGDVTAQLARLLPDLGPAIDDPETDGKARLFEAVVAVLARAGATRRVVLVVEDIHWIDAASHDLLRYVAQQIRRTPALVIVTYRPDEAPGRWRDLVAHLTRLATDRIELEPLDAAATVEMIALLAGTQLGDDETELIVRKTGGIPLLVEELVHAGGEQLPASVRDLLLARFNGLDDRAKQFVRTAAVLGARAPRSWLVAASHLGDTEARAAARAAVDRGVLEIDDDGRGYAFRHAMLRDAILGELIPDERVAYHEALAEALEAHAELDAVVDRTSELARHWDGAERPANALRWTTAAARQASLRFAFDAALALYERALVWWPGVADAATEAGMEYTTLLLDAADAAGGVPAYERAYTLARSALEAALSLDPAACADAFARSQPHMWAVERSHELEDFARIALEHIEAFDVRLRGRFLAGYVDYLTFGSRIDEVDDLRDEVLRAVEATGDPALAAHLFVGMAGIHEVKGELAHTEEDYARAAHHAQRAGLHSMHARVLYNWAATISSIPDLPRSVEMLRECEVLVAEYGIGRWHVPTQMLLAESLNLLGQVAVADEILTGLADLAADGMERKVLLSTHARVRVHQGRSKEVLAWYRSVPSASELVEPPRIAENAMVLAAAAAWNAELDFASRVVWEALDVLETRRDPFWHAWVATVAARVEVDRARRGDDDARDKLARVAREFAVTCRGLSARYALLDVADAAIAGEIARVDGIDRSAKARAAAEGFDALSMPYYRTNWRWREAEGLIAEGNRREAAAVLSAARAAAEHYGYTGLVDVINTTARAAQLRLGATHDADGTELLSGREVDVLRLLVEGKTNPQIAAELVIGTRTVGTHVANIFRKLGVNSRAEAATAAHQRGLV